MTSNNTQSDPTSQVPEPPRRPTETEEEREARQVATARANPDDLGRYEPASGEEVTVRYGDLLALAGCRGEHCGSGIERRALNEMGRLSEMLCALLLNTDQWKARDVADLLSGMSDRAEAVGRVRESIIEGQFLQRQADREAADLVGLREVAIETLEGAGMMEDEAPNALQLAQFVLGAGSVKLVPPGIHAAVLRPLGPEGPQIQIGENVPKEERRNLVLGLLAEYLISQVSIRDTKEHAELLAGYLSDPSTIPGELKGAA